MMNEDEKSDPAIVAVKPANRPEESGAELAEPRAGAKENARQEGTLRTPSREGASHGLDRVRQAARLKKKERFTALLHHVDVDRLREAYLALKREAAPGVDGVTWADYGQDLEARLGDLHGRVHRGAYRARPSRRRFIPKADGRLRPLGIAALEVPLDRRRLAAADLVGSPIRLASHVGARRQPAGGAPAPVNGAVTARAPPPRASLPLDGQQA